MGTRASSHVPPPALLHSGLHEYHHGFVVSSGENISLNTSFVYSTLVIHDILECNMEIVLLFAAFIVRQHMHRQHIAFFF